MTLDLRRETSDWPDPDACVVVVAPDGPVAVRGDGGSPRRWASVTKLVTALAVLDAAERGAVSLEDAAGPPSSVLSNLLDHSSGVAFDGDRVVAPPGRRRVYSNTGFELAAAHVQRRAGAAFPDLVATHVLGPLGLSSSALVGSPAHGLLGPCSDVAVLARELLRPRSLDPAVVTALSTTSRPGLTGVLPGFGRQDPNDWGLGAEVRGSKDPHWTAQSSSPQTFGHFGQSGTFLWVDPRAGVACVSASREPFGPWAVACWPRLAGAVLAAS